MWNILSWSKSSNPRCQCYLGCKDNWNLFQILNRILQLSAGLVCVRSFWLPRSTILLCKNRHQIQHLTTQWKRNVHIFTFGSRFSNVQKFAPTQTFKMLFFFFVFFYRLLCWKFAQTSLNADQSSCNKHIVEIVAIPCIPYRLRSDNPVPAGRDPSERRAEGGRLHVPPGGVPPRQGGQLPNSNHVSTVRGVEKHTYRGRQAAVGSVRRCCVITRPAQMLLRCIIGGVGKKKSMSGHIFGIL